MVYYFQSITLFSLDQRQYFDGGRTKLGAHNNISDVLNNVVVVLPVFHLYSILHYSNGLSDEVSTFHIRQNIY